MKESIGFAVGEVERDREGEKNSRKRSSGATRGNVSLSSAYVAKCLEENGTHLK